MTAGGKDVRPTPSPKEDPQRLALRGRPRPVIRFRRGLIVGLAAALSATLAVLAWIALEPPSFHAPPLLEGPEPAARAGPEALAGAPASYADVPKLGPPLPGDLGRPILERQRELEAGDDAPEGGVDGKDSKAERLRKLRQSALESPILASLGREAPQSQAVPPAEEAVGAGQARSAPRTAPDVPLPNSEGLALSTGTVIRASLLTGLNSDLPGIVLAQVTEPVRDSATGRTVLIPQGARLIGRYQSSVAYGQKRAEIAWMEIVFPDGSSIGLDKLPAADRSGYSGLRDHVDSHGWALARGVLFSTLLGVGSELSLADEGSGLLRAVREAGEQSGERAGERIVARELDVRPTLTVRPGWPVVALLERPLLLKPWRP